MRVRMLGGGISAAAALLVFVLPGQAQQSGLSSFKNYLAPFVSTPDQAVDLMLQMAAPKPGETLYDLGCGDGRIIIAAAERYKVKAVGIEISARLAAEAAENVKRAGLQKLVKVIHGDFMKADLSGANVVTLYLATSANSLLRPKLEHYLKPKSRVVSYDYPIPGWKPVDTSETEGHHGATHTIYLYEIPQSFTK
ncbi:MAG: SAM-dependent methyltransferase [Bryobacteraceae bacterium]